MYTYTCGKNLRASVINANYGKYHAVSQQKRTLMFLLEFCISIHIYIHIRLPSQGYNDCSNSYTIAFIEMKGFY